MTTAPELQLKLPARAEEIARVRRALDTFADPHGLHEQTRADVNLAVTEACANAIVHAYGESSDGQLEIEAWIGEGKLEVVVRDHGRGLVANTSSPGVGLGLPLIDALSDEVKFRRLAGNGTEVHMTFHTARSSD